MMSGIIERQIKTYLAGKSDAELLALVETLVIPRLKVNQMVLLRDLLDRTIAESNETPTVPWTGMAMADDLVLSFPRFGERH